MSQIKAVYFPLQGEQDVTRLVIEYYRTNSAVSVGIKQAFREHSLSYTPPLAYFKLNNFLRDPISSLGQRISDALPDILENRIEVDDFVSDIWPNGPDLTTPRKLELLIMPEEAVIRRAAIASLPVDLRSRHAGAEARQTVTTRVGSLPRSSACSSDPKQLFEHAGTLAGRPFGRCGPPTCIFDSHLAGLADALRDLAQAVPVPTSAKVAWAFKFFVVAVNFYNNEAEMEKMVRPLLNDLLDGGQWQHSIDGGRPEAHGPGWIYELKMQKGLGGDPEAQSIADCEKLLADGKTTYGKLCDRSRLPTILISQAGPQLDIAVAIYAQVVLVDQLFSINLRDGIDVDDQILTLARLATCLTNAGAALSLYYNGLQATAPVSPLLSSALHLPAPASATPPHSLLSDDLHLQFLYKLSQITGEPLNHDDEIDRHANTRHAVFVALGGGIGGIPREEVIVKFTKNYNIATHTKLAALGLAPQLYYHAAIRGGLLMIVMEKIVGTTAFRWLQLRNTTHLPLSVYTDIHTAISALHSDDLVFGDLRLPNIMIRMGEQDGNGNGNDGNEQGHGDGDASPRSDRGSADAGSSGEDPQGSSTSGDINVRAVLIDFDWTAQEGVGRYPATISTSVEWAPAVDPHGLMSKDHDSHSLRLLRQKCN
ncbi:hypothetical protein FB451DRAFT_1256371 [Mycena latifolia]|nr:hypothetical protein FB451DRAFT_1256371 [Mycena latifolia]